MKPPFTYYGGKIGMAETIVRLLPPHRVYIEPFLGSAAVFFAKRPAPHEILNDVDGTVTTFFRVLRDRPNDLERACRLTPYSRDEFHRADLDPDDDLDELERARRFWVRVNQSFVKTAGGRTGWSVTIARTQSAAASARSRIDRFRACARRLAAATIESCDGAELIERLATLDTVVYADPPYPAAARVGRSGAGGDFRCDMGSEEDHRRLAQVLRDTPAAVLLSGYHSPLYDELYGDWWRLEVPVVAHSSKAAGTARSPRVEVVWSNRSLTPPRQMELAGYAVAALSDQHLGGGGGGR